MVTVARQRKFIITLGGKIPASRGASNLAVVEIERRVIRPLKHPYTLLHTNDLALSCTPRCVGTPRPGPLFEQGFRDRSAACYLPGIPALSRTLSNLAEMYQSPRQIRLGEDVCRAQALAGRRTTPSAPEDADTVGAAARLALAYQSQRKFAMAASLSATRASRDQSLKRPQDWQRFLAETLLGA